MFCGALDILNICVLWNVAMACVFLCARAQVKRYLFQSHRPTDKSYQTSVVMQFISRNKATFVRSKVTLLLKSSHYKTRKKRTLHVLQPHSSCTNAFVRVLKLRAIVFDLLGIFSNIFGISNRSEQYLWR